MIDFLCGVALTLLLETVALIVAAERIRRKMDGVTGMTDCGW